LPTILRYSKPQLVKWLAISLVLGMLMIMRFGAQVAQGRSAIISLILLVAFAMAGLGFAVKLLGSDDTALAADATHLELVTLWRRHVLRWDEVRNVRIMVHTTRIFFVIPISRRRTLRVDRAGAWLGKSINLPLLVVERDDRAIQWLIETHMAQKSGGVAPSRGYAAPGLPRDPHARAVRLSDMPARAARSDHMPGARPGFGRKGV